MEILRVAGTGTSFSISQDTFRFYVDLGVALDGQTVTAIITDLSDSTEVYNEEHTVTGTGKIQVSVPRQYDSDYQVKVYDATTNITESDLVFEEFYEVRRPYVDPNSKGTTATDIAAYAQKEELARAVIDSVIAEGFYYEKKTIQTTGLGTDYIPLWVDAKKVLRVYENNILVYDASNPGSVVYEITADSTAITKVYSGRLNRLESANNILPAGPSDVIGYNMTSGVFPKTYDYTFVVAAGYNRVPSDIKRAVELIIDDIDCGKLEYYTRYIEKYDTDQFKLTFNKQVFEGTGNILVDKILSKYAKSITTLGVL